MQKDNIDVYALIDPGVTTSLAEPQLLQMLPNLEVQPYFGQATTLSGEIINFGRDILKDSLDVAAIALTETLGVERQCALTTIKPQNPLVPVMLRNSSSSPVCLTKGDCVAHLEILGEEEYVEPLGSDIEGSMSQQADSSPDISRTEFEGLFL